MDAQIFKRAHHGLHRPPARAELLPLFRLPLHPYLLRKLGRRANISPGKVQHERPGDDGHLNHLQFIVGTDELGNVESQDFTDACASQQLVRRALPQIKLRGVMRFDGLAVSFDLVFAHVYTTADAEAEPFDQ